MKLISSKKTKRRIALMFVFAFMLSNLLSLFGPSAKAAVTIPSLTAGTCFQHTGTVAVGGLVTVYSIGTIQISLLASDITPGQDATAVATANGAVAQATSTAGSISTSSADVIGNIFSIVPPVGTNFVIVPGFCDTGANRSNILATVNASISGAQSQDATGGANTSDLAIEVGIPTTGTAGVGRAIVAIARDSDTSGVATIGAETYPKSGTSSNTSTISINGLGIAIPPSSEVALSGTLQATFDATPPSGTSTYTTGNNSTATVAAAVPGLSGTLNICTVTSPAGQLEAVLDGDGTTDLYDKQATASPNLLALSQIGTLTRVHVLDTTTSTSSFTINGNAGASVDIEPILIRGIAGTGTATRDQVFATGNLGSNISAAAQVPSAAVLDVTTTFGNSNVAPITVAFATDNTTAMTVLQAVDVILENSTAGSTPASLGLSSAQTSRQGYLGALRAAVYDGGNTTSNSDFKRGSSAGSAATGLWGVASFSGGPANIALQEAVQAQATANTLGALTFRTGNSTEPFNNTFVDLRLECGSSTNPVAGWFAIINSEGGLGFGTTVATQQFIAASSAGGKILTNSLTNFYRQSLTNIAGTAPSPTFVAGPNLIAASTSNITDNAILYASCTSNTLTLVPIQNGFDSVKDIIAISPLLEVTNVSSTFTNDVNFIAQVSGNNLTGTTTLNLGKLVGTPPTGNSSLASAQGVALSESSQLGVSCSSGGQSSVVLSSVTSGTVATQVSAACTSGVIASAPTFFTGGAPNTVSGTTIVTGSPTVQGNGRGVLISELSATGFSELVNQVGGGTQGTVFEISLPTGCDVIDDKDDNNTASSSSTASAALGGNDVARITLTATGGVTATQAAGGSGNAALTNSNVISAASGAVPAKVLFRLSTAPGTGTDALTTDAVLVKFDAQDLFCPTSVTGPLTATVKANNTVTSPTVTSTLGTASLGTATQAITFGIADDVATSTKGEVSTNTGVGPSLRLVGGSASAANPFSFKENDPTSIPIGGRVSSRNLDPENSLLSSVITRGQIWIVPGANTAFSAAPAASDVTFSDNSLVVDGTPVLVTSSTSDANAPFGTLIIGVKRNIASGATDPATVATTVSVRNLQLAGANSSTTDLVASALFFSQDAGVIVNTPGSATGNNAASPTLFTPYVQGSTKALTQLEATGVQLNGGLANQLLTARLTTQGSPQLNPFAKVVTTAMNADSSKITVSGAAATTPTGTMDSVITVTGAAGSVDGGAQVLVTTGGSSAYDTVTVASSTDGSFTAKLRGDCATASSVTVTVAEKVSGTSTTSVTKTALCTGGSSGPTADSVFNDIAGSDGKVTISEVLSYVSANGGLSAIVSAGGGQLAGVIKAAKAALGLS